MNMKKFLLVNMMVTKTAFNNHVFGLEDHLATTLETTFPLDCLDLDAP